MAYATVTFTTAAPSQKSPIMGRCACSEFFTVTGFITYHRWFSFNQESIYSATTVTGVQESWLWVDHQLVKNKNDNILEAQNFFQKIIGTLSK